MRRGDTAGKSGKRIEKAELVFATFQHGSSRALDPQLHTHCLLLNAAVCEDGKVRAVSSLSTYRQKMAIGAIYRAELASILRNERGLETVRVNDTFEVRGASPDLIQAFSTRRREIERLNETKGRHSAIGSARSAIQTRPEKRSLPLDELRQGWQEMGNAHRFGRIEATVLLNMNHPERARKIKLPEQASCVIVAHGAFARKDLIQKLAAEAVERGISAREVVAAADQMLATGKDTAPLGNDRYTIVYGDVTKRRMQELDNAELRQRLEQPSVAKLDRIAVVPTKEDARAFEQASGIRTVTVDEFLKRHDVQQRELRRELDRQFEGEGKATMRTRIGPNILAPLEQFLDSRQDELPRKVRALLKKYGPDLGQGIKFLMTKVAERVSDMLPKPIFLNDRTLVVVHRPEEIRTLDMLKVVTAVDAAGSRLFVDGRGRKATQRHLERTFRQDLDRRMDTLREVNRRDHQRTKSQGFGMGGL